MSQDAFSWGTFEPPFLDELAAHLEGHRVLEVCAGNGLLAHLLRERGVDIHPTTIFRSMDGHGLGLYCQVEELDARDAAARYRESHDILLMCWPDPDEVAMQACLLWGEQRPVVFIGEVTDLEVGHLGGCASDLFFELSEETHAFETYSSGRSGLDRAAVRRILPGATEAYQSRVRRFTFRLPD
ncbi:hypothetical protein G6L37_05520 [Agrobacterium rubi]|nr:hypothetical protein [Agrobacterium rubi]NTF24817.1 hypothetical protein [Agrobacterium rubi]